MITDRLYKRFNSTRVIVICMTFLPCSIVYCVVFVVSNIQRYCVDISIVYLSTFGGDSIESSCLEYDYKRQ